MLYKRCLNLSGEYMKPIKPDTLQKANSSARSLTSLAAAFSYFTP